MAHLGDKLKAYRIENNMNQTQMAGFVGVGFRTYQDIEKTGEVKKSGVLKKIKDATGLDAQIIAHDSKPAKKAAVSQPDGLIGPKEFDSRTIYHLAEGNRIQSETNHTVALTNQKLVEQNIALTQAYTGNADHVTIDETVLLVKGMKDYLIEVLSELKQVPEQEVSQALYNKVNEVKNHPGKKGMQPGTGSKNRSPQ